MDIGFKREDKWFRYRAAALLVHENRMLFVKSRYTDSYYSVGGGVRVGESSKDCVEREFYEETGIKASADHLAVVCENFFIGQGGKIDGFLCHTVEHYYLMRLLEDGMRDARTVTDDGERLVWISLSEIAKIRIQPDFLKDHLTEVLMGEKIIHLVNDQR